MKQTYAAYTAEDFEVWRILFERQMEQLPGKATDEYLEGIRRINFTADRIPDFEQVNQVLSGYTGWQLHVVAGLIPNKDFFELLKNRYFPSSTWLRRKEQLDYLEEPDMFHDVFGHVPLLTNQHLCNFLADLSRIALRYIENDFAIELIARLYWYTVEFGLIREKNGLRIYGAGILSSKGETHYSLQDNKPKRLPYDVHTILRTPYIKEHFQDQYFVIDSYEQLYNSTEEIEQALLAAIAKENRVPNG